MKKIILLLALCSCAPTPEKVSVDSNIKRFTVSDVNDVYLVKIEGCEYLVLDGYESGGIIHKANCKNH